MGFRVNDGIKSWPIDLTKVYSCIVLFSCGMQFGVGSQALFAKPFVFLYTSSNSSSSSDSDSGNYSGAGCSSPVA